MVSTAKAQNELNDLKNYVIGIFKTKNKIHLVMNYQEPNQTVDLLTVNEFGVLQKEFNVPIDFGKLFLFPDNKNVNEMLNDVFGWAEFRKQFD